MYCTMIYNTPGIGGQTCIQDHRSSKTLSKNPTRPKGREAGSPISVRYAISTINVIRISSQATFTVHFGRGGVL